MSEKQREEVYRLLTTNHSITYASASVSAKRIDEINILQATFEAMSAAVKKVRDSLKQKKNVVVLIDGPKVPPAIQAACQTARGTRAEAVIGGDHKMFCIAAASIIAKVERDAYLVKMDAKYPGYGFAAHKGYGTEAHQDALRRLGVCAEHRKSYKPVAAQAARSARSKVQKEPIAKKPQASARGSKTVKTTVKATVKTTGKTTVKKTVKKTVK